MKPDFIICHTDQATCLRYNITNGKRYWFKSVFKECESDYFYFLIINDILREELIKSSNFIMVTKFSK